MARRISLTVGGPVAPSGSTLLLSRTDNAGLSDSFSLSMTHPDDLFGYPGTGKLYYGQTKLTSARETFYGQRVGVSHTYFNQTTLSSLESQVASDLAAGRVPMVTVALTTAWSAVATGALDSLLGPHLSRLNAMGAGPILWGLQSEPNGNGPPAADYKAMYQHVKTTFTDLYPQILLSPILAAGFSIMNGGFDMSDWMDPSSCDLPCFDSYNHISYNPSNGLRDLAISEAFGLQATQLHSIFGAGHPYGVTEWGVRSDPNRPGYASGWMDDAYDFHLANGAYCLIYFDSGTNVNDGGSSWILDDTAGGTASATERINQFKANNNTAATSAKIPLGGLAA